MRLKDLLHTDLSTLFGGGGAPEPRPPAEYFWSRIWRALTARGRRRRKPGASLDDPRFQPGMYYRMRRPRWRGPVYFSNRAWRGDLQDVIEQIAGIVRTNAPLAEGMAAAAREAHRLSRQWTGQRLWHIVLALALMMPVIVIGVSVNIQIVERLDVLAFLYFFALVALAAVPGIAVLNQNQRKESILLRLHEQVAAGAPLSDAMAQLDRFFPRFYADMVRIGEESGRMADCLDELGDETLRAILLGRRVRANGVYLGVVFAGQVIIVTFIHVKILPVFAEIFSEFGTELPRVTQSLIGVSDFVLYHIPHMLIGLTVALFLFVVFLRWSRRNAFSARAAGTLLFALPGLRGLAIRRNLAAAAVMLEKLLRAGVPMDRALEMVSEAEVHPLYRSALRRVRARVLEGEPLADALDAERCFAPVPKSFRGMVAVGERSGLLPDALARIADMYRHIADTRAAIVSDMLLPFGVLVLAAITLTVQLSLYSTLAALVNTMAVQY